MVQEWDLGHPPSLNPEDLLNFVYLDEFAADWKALHPKDEEEVSLWALEICIMSNPDGPPVVSGTGGLRKLRFGAEKQGKRGGDRICYAYFPDHGIVLMVMAYGKNRKDTLSASEIQGIKKFLNHTRKWLDDRSS